LIEALVVNVFTELSRPQRRVAKTPPQLITFISQPAMQNQLTFLMPFADDSFRPNQAVACPNIAGTAG